MSTPEQWGENFEVPMYAEPSWGIQLPADLGPFTIRVHKRGDCKGEHCVVHNPSDHPLKDAPLNWRGDKSMFERICEHGTGHDDPDGTAFALMMARSSSDWSPEDENYIGSHGCDGCCRR